MNMQVSGFIICMGILIAAVSHLKCVFQFKLYFCLLKLDVSMIFTTRRLAKHGICRRRRVSVRLSVCVCVCVCLSHSGIVSKRLNVGSCK